MANPVVNIEVSLPPDSQKVVQMFQELPAQIPQAIKRGMDKALLIVVGRIQENRLSGKGPFPPTWHRLGERSQQLKRSLITEPATISGGTVTGSILTELNYAGVHEFGKTIRGNPFLVFKIESFGQVSRRIGALESQQLIFARKVEIPARAPITTGVGENVEFIAGEIGGEIESTISKGF